MPLVQDMMGRLVPVPDAPRRIISLVPSQTELLADLGLEDEVVGITKFCVHPQRWFRAKPRVGGTKTVNADRVKALLPDLIIANKEENTKADIELLERIAPVWISDIHNLGDALQMIRSIGSMCGKEAEGTHIAQRIENDFASLRRCVPETGSGQASARNAAYCIWRNPWMWAGGDTFINDMLTRCGLRNVLHDVPRYPQIELGTLGGRQPEVILLSSEPYPFKDRHIAEVQAALPDAAVLLADGEMFSWYGSRLLHAPEYLSALLQQL